MNLEINMRLKTTFLLALWATLFLLLGCNTAEPTPYPPLEPGDPVRGEALFLQPVIGTRNAVGCVTCHSLQADAVLVGPSVAGIGSRAGDIVPSQTAEEYLRIAIVDPNAYMVPGYQSGSMYLNYGQELSPQEIEDLVAFMLTLE